MHSRLARILGMPFPDRRNISHKVLVGRPGASSFLLHNKFVSKEIGKYEIVATYVLHKMLCNIARLIWKF